MESLYTTGWKLVRLSCCLGARDAYTMLRSMLQFRKNTARTHVTDTSVTSLVIPESALYTLSTDGVKAAQVLVTQMVHQWCFNVNAWKITSTPLQRQQWRSIQVNLKSMLSCTVFTTVLQEYEHELSLYTSFKTIKQCQEFVLTADALRPLLLDMRRSIVQPGYSVEIAAPDHIDWDVKTCAGVGALVDSLIGRGYTDGPASKSQYHTHTSMVRNCLRISVM